MLFAVLMSLGAAGSAAAADPAPTGVEPSTPWLFAAIGAGIGFAFLVGVFLLARRQRGREDDQA